MENTYLATAAFGLEGVVANELKRLSIPARAEQGGARFTGTPAQAFKANLYLRTADRVLMVLAEREAHSFEDLFQLVESVAWERLLPQDAMIHVSGQKPADERTRLPGRRQKSHRQPHAKKARPCPPARNRRTLSH